MKFVITIQCDSSAFTGSPLREVARILADQARKLNRFGDDDRWSDTVVDSNGDAVGRAEVVNE